MPNINKKSLLGKVFATATILSLVISITPVTVFANNTDVENNTEVTTNTSYSSSSFTSSSSSTSNSSSAEANSQANSEASSESNSSAVNNNTNSNSNTNTNTNNNTPTNTPPTIGLNGDNPLTISVGQTFVDPGAYANDAEDGPLHTSIVVTGSVDNMTEASYTLTYSVTDSGGLSASIDRTVVVNPKAVFSVVATKIVCSTESDLPNWGAGSADINANTATNFLSTHPNCHTESGWNFQWGYGANDTGKAVTDPGNAFIGEAVVGNQFNEWKTFGPTDSQGRAQVNIGYYAQGEINAPAVIWVREVMKTGYIPFSGMYDANNPTPVSAELYCNNDIYNFDNFDYISYPATSGTYYCIAFNVPTTPVVNPPVNPPANTPPSITLLGSNPFTVATDTPFIDPGATSTDAEDGDLTSSIVVTGSVNASTTGSYVLTYSVTDSGGLSTSTTRTVIINATTTTPIVNPPVNPPANNGGGGGSTGGSSSSSGGGGIGGHRRDISNLLSTPGLVLGVSTTNLAGCSYLIDYIHKDWNNNPIEVLKVQSFLNTFEGESVPLNGVYDDATFAGVSRFQDKYASDILTPWGHTAPTGFVYILTKKKINEIYCNTTITLTDAQRKEIADFKAYLESVQANPGLKDIEIDLSDLIGSDTREDESTPDTSSNSNAGSVFSNIKDNVSLGLVEVGNIASGATDVIGEKVKEGAENGIKVLKNDSLKNIAVSLFGVPQGLDKVSSTYLIIALAVILAIAYAMRKNAPVKPGTVILEKKIEKKNKEDRGSYNPLGGEMIIPKGLDNETIVLGGRQEVPNETQSVPAAVQTESKPEIKVEEKKPDNNIPPKPPTPPAGFKGIIG